MILYDFQCESCGETFEALARISERTRDCGSCGGQAQRVITPVRIRLEGITGAFPTAYDRWAKVHRDQARLERRKNRSHSEP